MSRKVFFSFHYARDAWRVGQVRNSSLLGWDKTPFCDKAEWETVKKRGDNAIKRWIDIQLNGCSVTVVLIGKETADREWVKYEITESYNKGKGMLGIYINDIPSWANGDNGVVDMKGRNPFNDWYIEQNGRKIYFSEMYKTYDWVLNNGRNNMQGWIDEAAINARR